MDPARSINKEHVSVVLMSFIVNVVNNDGCYQKRITKMPLNCGEQENQLKTI